MKRFFALLMAVVMLVCMAVPALAGQEETVVDLGVQDMGNGITCKTTLIINENLSRASQKCGSVVMEYSYLGNWIGSLQLNGCFTYDGKTATATRASPSF